MKVNKKIIAFLAIIIILLISLNMEIKDIKDEKVNIDVLKIDIESIDDNTDRDITQILLTIDDIEDYYKLKNINKPILDFFININERNYSYIKLFEEYIDFYNLDTEKYLEDKYSNKRNLFYEIIDIKESNDKYIVDLIYKEENKDTIYNKTFTTDGELILDDAFLYRKTIDEITEYKGIIIEVKESLVFENKEIFKIIIKNNTNETFVVKDDKYGIYALKGNNKYYHENTYQLKNDYRIYPNSEKDLYITFNNLNHPEKIYLIINNGEEILIYK